MLQTSVGTDPFAKYSVYMALPLGSWLQIPETASLPDFLHILAVSMLSGTGKPGSDMPSWTLDMIFLHNTLWKEVPPFWLVSFWLLS